MTKEKLEQYKIEGLDYEAMKAAQNHWDSIAKPLDGLGMLEKIIVQIAGIKRTPEIHIPKRAVIAMCADNGIVQEGVSQTSQEVTAIVAANMAKGSSSVCRMGTVAKVDVIPVNIGIRDNIKVSGLVERNIMHSTRNFLQEPAMTQDEVMEAIQCGIDMVEKYKKQGYDMFATGEMGIGNTTTSSALTSVLLHLPVEIVTGKGAGLSKKGIEHKKKIIQEAIEKYQLTAEDPLRALQCVGGLDIAGLTGVYIGGALFHVPIVIDGIIASIAALIAERLLPGVREYMIPSHRSMEPAAGVIMKELELHPIIDASLALGEGTGAVLLFPMLDMALEVYHENDSFQEIHVEKYERFEEVE